MCRNGILHPIMRDIEPLHMIDTGKCKYIVQTDIFPPVVRGGAVHYPFNVNFTELQWCWSHGDMQLY